MAATRRVGRGNAAYGSEVDGHRGDRDQQGPEGGRGHRVQELGQGPLAAPQPGCREQTHTDVRDEQQPGGGRVGVREQRRGGLGFAARDAGQRGADLAAAQHVEADRAQRARDRAARLAVTGVLVEAVNSVSAASSSGISRAAIRPKPRSRPASAYATTKTAPAITATVVSGSGTWDSSTCDAVLSVTTSAVNSAARTALSWVPDMSIAEESVPRTPVRGP